MTAVVLLAFLAISSLSGLLGEAQIDYSAGVVRDAMTNASDFFADARALADAGRDAGMQVSLLADEMLGAFNESDLPEPLAFELSGQGLRFVTCTCQSHTEMQTDPLRCASAD